MGAKGPFFILLLGIGATASFALMAKLLLDEVPTAQALVDYRQSLGRTLEPEKVEIRASQRNYTVRLHGGQLTPIPPADAAFMPDFAGEFRRIYKPKRTPRSLEVVYLTPGSSCRSAEEQWRLRYDFEAEAKQYSEAIAKKYGAKACRIRVLTHESVRLETVKAFKPKELKSIAGQLKNLWGGGWKTIQIRHGGRVVNFDEDGQPLR